MMGGGWVSREGERRLGPELTVQGAVWQAFFKLL